MASQGPQSKAQLGPPGYEYTLPGLRFEKHNKLNLVILYNEFVIYKLSKKLGTLIRLPTGDR